MSTSYNNSKGFSFIQLIISFAVIAALVGIVTPRFISFRRQQALQNTTNALVGLLNEARSKTLASVNNTFYSVRLETTQAILFTGSTYTAGISSNKIVVYETPVVLQSTSFSPSTTPITFSRITGATTAVGSVTLTVGITGDASRTITVTQAGSISRN